MARIILRGNPAYDMAGKNSRLPLRGGIRNMVVDDGKGQHYSAFSPDANNWDRQWLDPADLEEALAADPGVRKAAQKALACVPMSPTAEAKAVAAVRKEVERVFDEKILTDIIDRFSQISPDVARYCIALVASGLHPKDIEQ